MVSTMGKFEGKGEDEGECSTRYAVDDRQQLEHVDDESYSSIMGLGNLTLSDNHTDETRMPNQSRIPSASASAYWPHSRGMPVAYDPNFTSSFHKKVLRSGGMRQFNPQPPLYTAPSITSNVDILPQEVLVDIFQNPYKYMTSPTASRSLSALLDNPPTLTFIDNFVIAITQSKSALVYAACTHQGTLLIQKVISEAKNRPVIAKIPLVLSDHTILLMTNKNGMHVVKQCFVQLDYTKYRPLYEKLMEEDNWLLVARDMTGCRGLNSCMDYMEHSNKYHLLSRIAHYAQPLAMDVYANYVLQHVIDMQTFYTGQIVTILIDLLDTVCTVKNGSHLLEKCLSTPYYSEIVQALVKSSKIVRYATHEFANYVIQKALVRTQAADPGLYMQLVNILCRNRTILMNNRHGRFVARLLPDNI